MALHEEIAREHTYFREFHHKCVSWYVQIMGFFIAGLLAAKLERTDPNHKVIGLALLVAIAAVFLAFSYTLLHYAGRIESLRAMLDEESPPNDWRTKSRNAPISLAGRGAKFFMVIFLAMGILAAGLTWIRLL